jgi:hypothetical protein
MERIMQFKRRSLAVGLSLATGLVLNSALALNVSAQQPRLEASSRREFCQNQLNGKRFARTELFFGLSRPGGEVTEAEFQNFIDTIVTPLFPAGLTLLTGTGQFQSEDGSKPIQERSKLLILFYPFTNESSRKIEQIRAEYITKFQQQSVLRVDENSCVSF